MSQDKDFEVNFLTANYSDKEWITDLSPDSSSVVDALILAIKYHDEDSIKSLFAQKFDINSRDNEDDWTLLMLAVHEELLNLVKLLVEAGADVNLQGARNPEEDFALNFAALAKHQEMFNYLLPLTHERLILIAKNTWLSRQFPV